MNRRRTKKHARPRRVLFVEPLESRIVLSGTCACAADGDLHSIPFAISGGGPAPEGFPLFEGGVAPHFATGEATRLGAYDGAGFFRLDGFTSQTTGLFSSPEPFIFGGSNGDQLAFHYGSLEQGAESPGEFTIFPQADGNVIVEFVAEFTLDPAQSTGRFEKYTDGSFVMIATTEPFSPEPGDDGYTEGFEYTWVGTGHLSFPVGTVYQVTSTADSGEGTLREAIEQANSVTEGIDTITFAPGLKGDIPLSSQLTISDDLTICGPGHQLAVSGQQEARVFNVDPFGPGVFGAPGGERIAVEIHDLTIADGLALDSPGIPGFAFGGGIYNRGSDLALESVKLTGNQAGDGTIPVASGGAVANEFGGTLTVHNSRFQGNSVVGRAVSAGGAISADVGPTEDGLGTKSPVTLVTDSHFSRNTASTVETDPVAAGPFAAFAGFAFGGAINALAGEFVAQDSTFVGNSVHGGDAVNGNDAGNANGGAILVSDFSPFIVAPDAVPGRDSINRIERGRFLHNAAQAGQGDGAGEGGYANGGAIAANIAFPFFPQTLEVSESVFFRNRANGGSGGNDNGDGGLGAGGAIAGLSGASISVDAGLFVGNVARGGQGDGSGTGGMGLGGAIGLAPSNTSVPTPFEEPPFLPSLYLSDSLLVHNRALGGDGGRFGDGGHGNGGAVGVLGAGSGTLTDATILHNLARGGRGGRAATGGNGQGGGIYNDAAILSLTSSTTALNRAQGGSGQGRGNQGEGLGGGIFNSSGGTLEIDAESLDATFFNHASDRDFQNIFGDLTEI